LNTEKHGWPGLSLDDLVGLEVDGTTRLWAFFCRKRLQGGQTSEENERTLGILATHGQRLKADSSTQQMSV